MIDVGIFRATGGAIIGFEVKGHALFAEEGKDIVCAGVSAITVGTVNALEELLQAPLAYHMEKGQLEVSLLKPETLDSVMMEQVQLIFKTMLVMLNTIEHSYGSYIAIQDHNKGGKPNA